MKIKCINCSTNLSVDLKKLAQAPKPIVKCYKCKQTMAIQPRRAKCGACDATIMYHEFKLNPEIPLLPCSSCKKINRMPISKSILKKTEGQVL